MNIEIEKRMDYKDVHVVQRNCITWRAEKFATSFCVRECLFSLDSFFFFFVIPTIHTLNTCTVFRVNHIGKNARIPNYCRIFNFSIV